MILEILQDIKRAIKGIPDLQMLDLDRGQLKDPELHESLLLPALLVDSPEIDWSQLSHGNNKALTSSLLKQSFHCLSIQHFI